MKQALWGNRILIAVGTLTVLSGIATAFGGMQEMLALWNISQFTYPLAIAKIFGGALLIWSRTRTLGTLFTTAYFGGAIAIHVAFQAWDFMLGMALLTMALLWAGFFLREEFR